MLSMDFLACLLHTLNRLLCCPILYKKVYLCISSLILDQLGPLKNNTVLIPLLALYIWTMVLGYWSPQLPKEVPTNPESTWFQLDGRTDGSKYLAPTQYTKGTLEPTVPSTEPYPSPLPLSLLVESVFHTKIYEFQTSNVKANTWVGQYKANLLYPFHFFF